MKSYLIKTNKDVIQNINFVYSVNTPNKHDRMNIKNFVSLNSNLHIIFLNDILNSDVYVLNLPNNDFTFIKVYKRIEILNFNESLDNLAIHGDLKWFDKLTDEDLNDMDEDLEKKFKSIIECDTQILFDDTDESKFHSFYILTNELTDFTSLIESTFNLHLREFKKYYSLTKNTNLYFCII